MEKLQKAKNAFFCLLAVGILAMGFGIGKISAIQQQDPVSDQGYQRWWSAGILKFVAHTWQASGPNGDSLSLYSVTGSTYAVTLSTNGFVGTLGVLSPLNALDFGINQGVLGLPRMTSGVLAVRSPAYSGELVFNTTIGAPCVSTGTAADQYVKITTGTATTTNSCF